jgi:hypothetical protein
LRYIPSYIDNQLDISVIPKVDTKQLTMPESFQEHAERTKRRNEKSRDKMHHEARTGERTAPTPRERGNDSVFTRPDLLDKMERDYKAKSFHQTTEFMKNKTNLTHYWPKESDTKNNLRWKEGVRSGKYETEEALREEGRQVSHDNRKGQDDLKRAGVETKDFGYAADNPLHKNSAGVYSNKYLAKAKAPKEYAGDYPIEDRKPKQDSQRMAYAKERKAKKDQGS